MSKLIGDAGELLVEQLLKDKGYQPEQLPPNYPVVDLTVNASPPFRVSVKTSKAKHHVRLGRDTMLEQLPDNDFVFALMPRDPNGQIGFHTGQYRLLILPGDMVRNDGLAIHNAYLQGKLKSGGVPSGSAGVMVKGYSKKPIHQTTWTKWMTYENRWDLLPPAK